MDHSGIVLNSVDGFDVIHCESCGFKHIIPIPDEEELERIYKHEYHVKEKPLMLQHQLEDQEWHDATKRPVWKPLKNFLDAKAPFWISVPATVFSLNRQQNSDGRPKAWNLLTRQWITAIP